MDINDKDKPSKENAKDREAIDMAVSMAVVTEITEAASERILTQLKTQKKSVIRDKCKKELKELANKKIVLSKE